MRKFTISDFWDYGKRCFICQTPTYCRIGTTLYSDNRASYLNPIITKRTTKIECKLGYYQTIGLTINHKTNKLEQFSNVEGLINYLSDHKLYLQTRCSHCFSEVETDALKFDLGKRIVSATSLALESLSFEDKQRFYILTSDFGTKISSLTLLDKTKGSAKPTIIDLPLMPMYQFADKIEFMARIKNVLLMY